MADKKKVLTTNINDKTFFKVSTKEQNKPIKKLLRDMNKNSLERNGSEHEMCLAFVISK